MQKIMFLPLTRSEIKEILKLLIKDVEKMLGRQQLRMEMDEKSLDYLADMGYDPQFGARPMKRVLQKELINPLSKKILAGDFGMNECIYVSKDGKGLVFDIQEVKEEIKE